VILDHEKLYEHSVEYWAKHRPDPHPRVFYVMLDVANLLVKAGVTNCLYDRYKHRRLGMHVPYKYVLTLSEPEIESAFKKRFCHLKKEDSGTETFYATKELRDWIEWVQGLQNANLLPFEIRHRIWESLEVK